MRPTWFPNDGPIECTRGVVQGCPLGTVLFALSFAPAYEQAKAEVDPNGEMQLQLLAYADDLYAIAPHGATLTAFYNALTTHCATIGLELNSSKSGWLQPQHTNISTEDLNATLDIGARHNIMWVGGAPVRQPLASHKELHDAIAVRLHSMMHEVGSIANFTDPQHMQHHSLSATLWHVEQSAPHPHAAARYWQRQRLMDCINHEETGGARPLHVHARCARPTCRTHQRTRVEAGDTPCH